MKIIRELNGQFGKIDKETVKRASKYIVLTGDDFTDYQSIVMLELLRQNIAQGKSNDIAKYCLPENFKTELVWTINARSLQNFLSLRLSSSAHFEIRKLAQKIYQEIPDDAKFIFDEIYKNSSKNK